MRAVIGQFSGLYSTVLVNRKDDGTPGTKILTIRVIGTNGESGERLFNCI